MEADFTLIDLLLLPWKEKKMVVFVGTTYEQLLQDWNAQFYSDPSESAENPESVVLCLHLHGLCPSLILE